VVPEELEKKRKRND
jgi:hypothetical protein